MPDDLKTRGIALRPATGRDLPSVLALLERAGLPSAGVPEALSRFIVAEHQGELIGVVGLEVYGSSALLRSAAVDEAWRGSGVGRALVERVLDQARDLEVEDVFLLTTTAEHYFPRFGFVRVGRDSVPAPVTSSVEFQGACPDSAAVMRKPLKPLRVLFLCTGNSARSQMAEALLNWKGEGRFLAESAGSHPAERVNPYAIEVLEHNGIHWRGHPPRGLDGLERERWDLVITVCDQAREACPVFHGQPVVAHWGMPDPAAVEGDTATKRAAFRETFALISRRIDLLVGLPVEHLERKALQVKVQEIGNRGVERNVRSPS